MGAAIHLSTKRQVIYGDYLPGVTLQTAHGAFSGGTRRGPDDAKTGASQLEVSLSLMSGQSIKVSLSRRDATVKAARKLLAQLCCMPEQAVHLLHAGRVLEDELLLLDLESPQIIFDASYLRKGPLPGVSRLGLWHGVEARLRLLNPVPLKHPDGHWVHASLRSHAACRRRAVVFRYTADVDDTGNLHYLNAIKKSGTAGRHFSISIEGLDHYRARIFRPLSNKEYILYDPAASVKGDAVGHAREMGCLRLRSKRRVGPSDLDFVMPKVKEDGTAAQFRPMALKESISQIYERGSLEHLHVLRGASSETSIELQKEGGPVIFEAQRFPDADGWKLKFQHPLSHFQAFGIMIGVLDNACLATFHQ